VTASAPKDLKGVEAGVRALIMGKDEAFMDDVSRRGQEAYRELVRTSLVSNVLRGCPVAHARLLAAGHDGGITPLIHRFLDEQGPRTRLYRDVPLDFARWLAQLAQDDASALPHPSLAELIAWETLEIDVLLAPDAEPQQVDRKPSDALAVVFDPSMRLAAHQFPVHRLKRELGDGEAPFPSPGGPWVIVAWRGTERFKWRTVTPAFGQLLAVAAQTGAALGDVLAELRTMGLKVDAPFLRAQLVDFVGRGALLGFAAPDPDDA
jgi:hypothetical protein